MSPTLGGDPRSGSVCGLDLAWKAVKHPQGRPQRCLLVRMDTSNSGLSSESEMEGSAWRY